MLSVVMFIVIMLGVIIEGVTNIITIMLSVIKLSALLLSTFMLQVVILSAITFRVKMLIDIMLCAVLPSVVLSASIINVILLSVVIRSSNMLHYNTECHYAVSEHLYESCYYTVNMLNTVLLRIVAFRVIMRRAVRLYVILPSAILSNFMAPFESSCRSVLSGHKGAKAIGDTFQINCLFIPTFYFAFLTSQQSTLQLLRVPRHSTKCH